MEQLLSAADKAMSALPLNGNKALISSLVKLAMPILVGFFPILIPVAPAIDALADLGIAIGLSHKAVKASRK